MASTGNPLIRLLAGQLPMLLEGATGSLEDLEPARVDDFLVMLAAGALIARSDDATPAELIHAGAVVSR